MQCINGFTLSSVLDREYYVRDGDITLNNVTYASIYNGMMTCAPKNPLLLSVIANIVYNVSVRFMGNNPWESTGPRLLGSHLKIPSGVCDFRFAPDSCIVDDKTGKRIIVHYAGYREDQARGRQVEYYQDLWRKNAIYSECQMDGILDLAQIYRRTRE